MERLTKRFNDGTAGVIRQPDQYELIDIADCIEDGFICDSVKNAVDKLERYEATSLDPDEIEGLKKSEDLWHREAIRLAAELGELKMKIGKLIESNLPH